MASQICQEVENYAKKLMSDLNRERFELESSCDAILHVDGKDFQVHKNIVGKVSPFFRKLFEVEMKEKYDSFADMKGMKANLMECILTYIYTGIIKIEEDDLEDLFLASNFLQIDELKGFCGNYFVKTLTVSTCLGLYSLGKRLDCQLIHSKAKIMMQDNVAEIIREDEFKNICFADVMTFLQSIDQTHSVYKVKAVYEGITTWVNHDLQNREEFLCDLLEVVMFQILPSHYFNIIKKDELFERSAKYQSVLNNHLFWKRASNQYNSTPSRKQFVVINGTEIRLFDVLSLTWKQLPHVAKGVSEACVVTYKDHLYLIGGTSNPRLIQRLNLEEEDAEWKVVGQTLHNRIASKAVLRDDEFVISGGRGNDSCAHGTVETFNACFPSQKYLAPMKYSRYHHSMALHGGHLLCNFGDGDYDWPTEALNANTQAWEVKDEKKQSYRCAAVAASAGIFVFQYQGREIQFYNVRVGELQRTGVNVDSNYDVNCFDAISMEGKICTFGRQIKGKCYRLMEYDMSSGSQRQIWTGNCEFESSVITAI